MSHDLEYEFVFSLTEMLSKSFCALQAMRQNGDLCDVTFYVKGKKIFAHRAILAANIPYFTEMFLHNYATSQREIVFEMMEPYAFESLIEFAYTNEIKINIDNARSLLIGATLLKMDEVSNACTKFISNRLHPGNALEIQKFASTNYFVALQEATDKFVQEHFFEISHSEEFLNMSYSDLKELISKDELHVMSEEDVFQAVVAWVKRSPSDRECKLSQLLSVVRLPLLSYRYLSTSVANEELIAKSVSCVNLVNEAKTYWKKKAPFCNNLPVGHRNFSMASCRAKNNSTENKRNNYLYALCRLKGKEAYPTVVARYNLMTTEWKMMNARTTFVKEAAVVVMGTKLYVIGGCNSIGRLLDAVQVFDTESDSWSFIEPFPSKICQAAAAVFSGKIYVFGGKTNDDESTRYMYCYSPETKWKYVDKMYQSRRAACAVTMNDCIYILGGHDDKKPLSSVEMYNPAKDNWNKVSSLGMEENCCGATSVTNRIYVCGKGYLQFYDDHLKEWDKINKTPRPDIENISILGFKERLYVVGGKSEIKSGVNYLYIYDLESDKWINGQALSPNMSFISAVLITEHS